MDQTIMKDTEIQQIRTTEQIQSCYTVMRQLRPHLTEEQAFIDQVQRQLAEGYRLASWQEEGEVRALVGFRFLEFLAWGKVLYIDDLITDSKTRKNGQGGNGSTEGGKGGQRGKGLMGQGKEGQDGKKKQ